MSLEKKKDKLPPWGTWQAFAEGAIVGIVFLLILASMMN